MSRLALSFVAASLGLSCCTEHSVPSLQASADPHPVQASPPVYTLRCQLTYFPLGAEAESDPPQQPHVETLTLQGDNRGEVTIAGLRMHAYYVLGQAHHSGVKLDLSADGAPLLGHMFQLPEQMPLSELGGGFTGTVSLRHPGHGGDYQYYCELLRAPAAAR